MTRRPPTSDTSNPSDTIDCLELLSDQHLEVDNLIARLEAGTRDKERVFAELANKLAAHATIEEKIFYPAAMMKETKSLLEDSVDEHLEVKRVLTRMMECRPDGDEFDDLLADLKAGVSHHAHEEEEAKLFPKLRQLMSADERAGLGNEMLAMFEALMESEPRENVPGETDHPAPLPAI